MFYVSIHLLMDLWVSPTVWLLQILLPGTFMCKELLEPCFQFLACIRSRGLAESRGDSAFAFVTARTPGFVSGFLSLCGSVLWGTWGCHGRALCSVPSL